MRKIILLGILGLFLLTILFLFKEEILQAQSSIGIELYVYPKGFYGPSPIKIENAENDTYKTPLKSTVVAETEYQMILKGVGNATFTLEFNSGSYNASSSSTCTGFGGSLSGSNCIIEGSFDERSFQNPNDNYQKWAITVKQNGKSASISFYLVKQSYAQNNVSSKNDQYYLEPTSTTASPTSQINYKVYSNKLYCPIYMASGISKTTPGSIGFTHFTVNTSTFISNIYVSKILQLNNVATGTYSLYLVNPNNNSQISQSARITVERPISPPPPDGVFNCINDPSQSCKCVLSYCYWWNRSAGKWEATSSSACGNKCAGGVRE